MPHQFVKTHLHEYPILQSLYTSTLVSSNTYRFFGNPDAKSCTKKSVLLSSHLALEFWCLCCSVHKPLLTLLRSPVRLTGNFSFTSLSKKGHKPFPECVAMRWLRQTTTMTKLMVTENQCRGSIQHGM